MNSQKTGQISALSTAISDLQLAPPRHQLFQQALLETLKILQKN
jgi:hypothetical protein